MQQIMQPEGSHNRLTEELDLLDEESMQDMHRVHCISQRSGSFDIEAKPKPNALACAGSHATPFQALKHGGPC